MTRNVTDLRTGLTLDVSKVNPAHRWMVKSWAKLMLDMARRMVGRGSR